MQLHCVWYRRVEGVVAAAVAFTAFALLLALAPVGRRCAGKSVASGADEVAATSSARGELRVTLPLRSNRRSHPVCGDCARSRCPLLFSVGRYSQPLSVVPYTHPEIEFSFPYLHYTRTMCMIISMHMLHFKCRD